MALVGERSQMKRHIAGGKRWIGLTMATTLLLAACQPAAAPAPTSAPKPTAAPTTAAKPTAAPAAAAKPIEAAKPAAAATTAPAGKPAATTAAIAATAVAPAAANPAAQANALNVPKDWNAVVAAAKQEGTVRIIVPAGVPGLGDIFAKAFQEEFGIKLEYTAENTGPAQQRIEQEVAAGRNTTDVILSGATEFLNLYPANRLAPIAPILMHPEVVDQGKWRDGKLTWADNAQQFMPLSSEWVHIDLMVNSSIIDPKSITSWKDLLKPEYKGKIVAQEVTVGAGGATARALLEDFGPDYITQLYKGQNVTMVREAREVVETMARGSQPIGMAILPVQSEAFRKQGIKLERVFPTDGLASTSGGSAVAKIIVNPPHPNAAVVFTNWFLAKRGQQLYTEASLEPSRRTDVSVPAVPEYIIPKPGTNYRNQYREDYYVKVAPAMRTQIEQLLGR